MADASFTPAPTIALLTDFGWNDPYVGQMKGVLRALAPEAEVIDLSHGVPAYRVETGAFFLAATFRYFPAGTVFVAVVDPWVGTQKRDILVLTGGGFTFVGPDNGILSLTSENLAASEVKTQIWRLKVNPVPYVPPTGLTFAGRDIMAPLAARLCRGETMDEIGEPVALEAILRPIWVIPERTNGKIFASVLHVDHFGNVILNLAIQTWAEALAAADVWLVIDSAGAQAAMQLRIAPAYAELLPGKVGLVPGGQGYLELAMYRASAADKLGLKAGDMVHLGISG